MSSGSVSGFVESKAISGAAVCAAAGGPGAGPWPVAALRMEYAPGVAEFASPDSVMAQTFRLLPMWAVAKLPEAYEVEHSLPAG